MILKIRQTTDPILREPTEEVRNFDHELQFLIDNMIETMRRKEGVGLAAPQVGVSKKIFVCEYQPEDKDDTDAFPLTVICNPKITSQSKENTKMVEGCLSFPELNKVIIDRPKKISIQGQDRYGKDIEIKADGLFSRVLQHENDHLNSILLIDHLKPIKILYIGTGTLGLNSLELLAKEAQYEIVAVVTGEPGKPSGRKVVTNNPVEKLAEKLKLPIIRTTNINEPNIIEKLKKLDPDLAIMADFGQIVSGNVLKIPKYGVINIHPSLLPKYRGPSPLQAAILSGDKRTGVSLILTTEKMDAGPIISQAIVDILPSETVVTLKKLLSEVAATLLLNTIPYYIAGDLEPISQDEQKATYTRLFKSSDGLVEQGTTGREVERKIRAFGSWPRVHVTINGKRVLITSAYIDENGKLVITKVQPEGKKEMSYDEYKRGYKTELTFD